MLLMCPSCRALVETTTDAAGQMRCPRCQHEFASPQRYEPEVLAASGPATPPTSAAASSSASSPSSTIPPPLSSIPPPPSSAVIVPPRIAPPVAPSLAPEAASAKVEATSSSDGVPPLAEGSAEYARTLILTLRPAVLHWVPAVLLSLALFSTFFPWVGLFVGGSTVYAQGPWSALFGRVETNPALVEVVKWPTAWVDQVTSDAVILLPALMLLILAVLLAWGDRRATLLAKRLNPRLERLGPWRRSILIVCTTAATFLFFLSVWRGWGLERALWAAVNEQFATERNQAIHSPSQQAFVQYKIDQELHRYNLKHTFWQHLGLASLFLSLLALLLTLALERRENRPPPRFVIQY